MRLRLSVKPEPLDRRQSGGQELLLWEAGLCLSTRQWRQFLFGHLGAEIRLSLRVRLVP